GRAGALPCKNAWGRAGPVFVAARVGCAADVVDATCGRIFAWNDWTAFGKAVEAMFGDPKKLANMRRAAGERTRAFDVGVTESALVAAVDSILQQTGH